MEFNTLVLLVTVPLGIAVMNLVLPTILQKLLMAAGTLSLMWFSFLLYKNGNMVWSMNDQVFLQTTPLSILCIVFVQIISFIILLFAIKGMNPDLERRFFILFPLTVALSNGALASEHSIFFLTFWGFSGVLLYLFGVMSGNGDASQSAKKTFMIIGGSDAFLIMGFAILWTLQPGSNWSLTALNVPLDSGMSWMALIFLLLAAFAKAGCFPFHTWVPDYSRDTHVEAVVLLPASIDKLLGIYLLAMIVTVFFQATLLLHMILITVGAVSIITAVMMALTQHDGRRLLGYHAVSQVGYMVLGVGSGSLIAFAGGLFHMINNVLYKSGLFLSMGAVEKKTGTHDLDKLGGLARSMPLTFIMALVAALSISGIPPFNGFFSKWMIYQGLVEMAGSMAPGYQLWLLLCLILAVFGSALTLASFLKFIHAVFLGKRPEKYNAVDEAPINQWLSTGVLALLCLVFGLFAIQIPLKLFVLPVAGVSIESLPIIGLYQPVVISILFLIMLIFGLLIYRVARTVRYDQNYIGGMPAHEKYRVSGTGFYNEIRRMSPLKALYDAAEKKIFDIYNQGAGITNSFAGLFQKAHPGQLQLYLLYMIVGLLIFIFLI